MKTISAPITRAALLATTFAVSFGPTSVRASDPTIARTSGAQQQTSVASESANRHNHLADIYGRAPIGSSKGLGSHFHALAAHFRFLAKTESESAAGDVALATLNQK